MSNRNCFKCLFEFNSYKYCVIIDKSNESKVSFDSLLNQFKVQTNSANVSMETHSFEIFDNDFNEYVLIVFDKQLVKDLSRIRVKSKVNSRSNIKVSCNPSDEQWNDREDSVLPKHTFSQNSYKNPEIKTSNNSQINSIKAEEVLNQKTKYPEKQESNVFSKHNISSISSTIIPTNDSSVTTHSNKSIEDSVRPKHTFNQKSYINPEIKTSITSVFANNSQTNGIKTDNTINEEVLVQKTKNPEKQESNVVSKHNKSSISSTIRSANDSSVTTQSNKSIEYGNKEFLNTKIKQSFKEINDFGPKIIKSDSLREINDNINTTDSRPHSYFSSETLSTKRGSEKCLLNFDIKVENIENQNLYALKFSENEFKAYKILLQIIKQSKHTKDNLLKGPKHKLYEIWKPLSDSMVRNGFKDWDFRKCYQSFKESLNIYEMVLNNAPNNSIAIRVYPLFDLIYKLNKKPDIEPEISSESTFESQISRFLSKWEPILNQNPYSITSLSALHRNIEHKSTSNNNNERNVNPINTEAIPYTYFDFKSLGRMKYENKFIFDFEIKVKKSLFVLQFNYIEINKYKLLLKTMKQNIHLFIDYYSGNEWKNICITVWKPLSQLKVFNEYKWSFMQLCITFDESVELYRQILMLAPNQLIASKVYPLFDIINKFDLKHFIDNKTYDYIKELKVRFERKSSQSVNNSVQDLIDIEKSQKKIINSLISNEISIFKPKTSSKNFLRELKK